MTVAFLINVNVTVNVYVGTLVTSLAIGNITTTVTGPESVVVSGAPARYEQGHVGSPRLKPADGSGRPG